MKEPPPLVLFTDLTKYLSALDDDTRAADESAIRALCAKELPPVASTRSLGVLFGFRPQFIGTMRHRPRRYYNVFEIRKGRKKRRIQAPRVAIKIIQKWFGHYLSRAIEFPPHVVGFVPGRSSIEAASRHCQKDWIFSTDIADCFQTTAATDVIDSLVGLGYSETGAELITDLNCLGGSLAQGSPASPVLANLAMTRIDDAISKMARRLQATFTRYADDIVISGIGKPPDTLRSEIEQIFRPTTWRIAEHKTRLVTAGDRMKVHGLLVHEEKPRLTKGYRRRIRAIRHLHEHGKIPESELASALGHLAYAESVENFGKEQASR